MKTLKNLNEQNLLEEKLYDKQLQECMEELENIIEDFSRRAKPKRKATNYLGKGIGDNLSKGELRRLRAKAGKLKKSKSTSERRRGIQLGRQVSFAFNTRKE